MSKKSMCKACWNITKAYLNSEEKWWARGMLGVVVALNLAQVYFMVELNTWYNDFYNVLQNYDYDQFWPLIGVFSGLAFFYIIAAVYAVYIRQMLEIRWRTWMTRRYLDSWMGHQVFYRMKVLGTDLDNPDQRISEDINQFITYTLTLSLGLLKQLTILAAFVVILWNLSGTIDIPAGDSVLSIPGYMVFISLFYAICGTWLADKVGHKLIGLNFDQQRYEADFRFNMVRVRENAESIAFYGGEEPELMGFRERFSCVIKNFWSLMRQTKLLNFYIHGYAQLAVIVPLIMAAPKYFGGEMQLGGLMQTISAFGRVQDALSYFVESYDSIASYIAVLRRLDGFTGHMAEVDSMEDAFIRAYEGNKAVCLDNFNVSLPDNRLLIDSLELNLMPGERLLISGRSGCGKSTLLRALAGIWPYGSGKASFMEGTRYLFLPQRPYLPLGSLRRAIYYPQPVPENETDDLAKLMERAGIGGLASSLDEVDDWSRILSLGEQQRLAFVRILLYKPQVLFLDESTSALDEENERSVYELIRRELPDTACISVGHRSSLAAYHDKRLKLDGNGGWQLEDI